MLGWVNAPFSTSCFSNLLCCVLTGYKPPDTMEGIFKQWLETEVSYNPVYEFEYSVKGVESGVDFGLVLGWMNALFSTDHFTSLLFCVPTGYKSPDTTEGISKQWI